MGTNGNLWTQKKTVKLVSIYFLTKQIILLDVYKW
jgi:hypothetical protein